MKRFLYFVLAILFIVCLESCNSYVEKFDKREQKLRITDTKERDDVWASILALCMATPRDITPDDEDPVQCVNERLNDLRELLGDAEYNLQALHDIRDGWETREED